MSGHRVAALCLLVATGTGVTVALAAASARLDPGRVRWSELDYRASKLMVTATSKVRIGAEPAVRAASHWIDAAPGRPVSAMGAEVIRVRLQSEILGKKSDLDLWLDPVSAAAIQRIQLETGKKVRHHRHRALRFTQTGVFNVTHRATDDTVDRPWRDWDPREVFEPFPTDMGVESRVTEPSALFYLLAVADLDQVGDSLTTFVFSKGQVMRVRLTAVERTEVKVDFIEVGDSGERRIRGRREVLRIDLDGTPVSPEGSDRDFEFLGLRGDVAIYLEPDLRLPLQISGNIRYAGKSQVRLQRAVVD